MSFVLPFWFAPTQFGLRPITSAVREGAVMFRQRRAPESVWTSEERGIGLWFDGKRKRTVEKLVWISPIAVSRRLGYLQAAEGWSEETLQKRWLDAREFFGHGYCFVARLCAFPKQDLFEDAIACKSSELAPFVATLRVGDRSVELSQTPLEERGDYDARAVGTTWVSHPAFEPLQGLLDRYEVPQYPSGPFRSRLVLLSCPTQVAGKFLVVLADQGKQRQASFDVFHSVKRRRSR